MHDDRQTHDTGSWGRKASRIAFIGFAAIAASFLVLAHRAHLWGIVPFLLLAACPLLHMFGHSGRDTDASRTRNVRDVGMKG